MRQCITHHHACDCREQAMKEVINDLLDRVMDKVSLTIYDDIYDYYVKTIEDKLGKGYLETK